MVTMRSAVMLFANVAFFLLAGAVPVPVLADEDGDDIRFLFSIAGSTPDTAMPAAEPILPRDETSELVLFSRCMIRLYQEFVSSQHHNVCVFTPSCSHFGMSSVREFGFFRGVLLTSDRLSRCHTSGLQSYSVNHSSGKLMDPVESYLFEGAAETACAPGGVRCTSRN